MAMTEEKGIKRTNGKAFCEACGNDLSVNGSVRHVAHLDGAKCYTDCYECTKCGAGMSITHERKRVWG